MHFSIPDTTLCRDSSGSFVTYNIHINGSFHCSLRYRQLYQFHLQLKSTFGGASLCPFPPKKLFSLSSKQLEERRSSLEKFLQIASQDSEIVASPLFNDFLLSAQQDTHLSAVDQSHPKITPETPKILELHQQLNSVQTTVRLSVDVSENSATVLQRWATVIGLNSRLLPYFCLYLVRRLESPASVDFRVVRRLANYESPYLTLLASEKRVKSDQGNQQALQNGSSPQTPSFLVMIRKSYWDPALDEDLFGDRVALNVLYLIAHHEVEKGHVVASKEVRHRLTELQAKGEKVEYLRLARTLKFYGYVHFEPCSCDHLFALATLNAGSRSENDALNSKSSGSRRSSPVKICAGNQELVVRLVGSNEETVFRVIRIKCWRLTTSSSSSSSAAKSVAEESSAGSSDSNGSESSNPPNHSRYELSFEYLVKQGTLVWISISSPQAVLISTCLQAMVEEMLVRREGKKFRSEGLALHYHTSPSFSSAVTTTTSSSSSTSTSNSTSNSTLPSSNDSLSETSANSTKNGHQEKSAASQAKSTTINNSSISSSASSASNSSSSSTSSPIEFVDSQPKNPANNSGAKVRYSRLVENNVFDEIGEEDL